MNVSIDVRYDAVNDTLEISPGAVKVMSDCNEIMWQLVDPAPPDLINFDIEFLHGLPTWTKSTLGTSTVVASALAGVEEIWALHYKATAKLYEKTLQSDERQVGLPTPADEQDGTIVVTLLNHSPDPAKPVFGVDKPEIVLINSAPRVKWDCTILKQFNENAPSLVFTGPSESRRETGPFAQVASLDDPYILLATGNSNQFGPYTYVITNDEQKPPIVTFRLDPQIDNLPPPPETDPGKRPFPDRLVSEGLRG